MRESGMPFRLCTRSMSIIIVSSCSNCAGGGTKAQIESEVCSDLQVERIAHIPLGSALVEVHTAHFHVHAAS